MKVLVVENSPAISERLLALLAVSGIYEGFGCAASVTAALAFVETSHPDAVLLDQRLDDGSGFQLLELLRGRGLGVPVVMLSTSQGSQYQLHAQKLGADAFLCKSTQFEEIIPTLNRLLSRPEREVAGATGPRS